MTSEDLQARLTAIARDMILIPSTNTLPEERKRCLGFIENHIDHLSEISIQRYDSNGYESLVATPKGVEQPDVLFCGHIDVIDHANRSIYRSHIKDNRIYGPGAGDMKGANSIILELFRHFHETYPGISLGLAFTSDEEIGGYHGTRYLLDEVGLRCGIAIIPDGGSLTDITVEEKGVIHLRITQHGLEAHGARPWLGHNALELLNHRVSKLKDHFQQFWPEHNGNSPMLQTEHWFPTCALTIMSTPNQSCNRIPAVASAILDIRLTPPHSIPSMIETIHEILGDCEIESLMTAEPTNLAPDPLFCDATAQITGKPINQVKASGGSDGRFFRKYGIPVNLSRPLVGHLHRDDEWIDIPSMEQYYRICELYLKMKLTT